MIRLASTLPVLNSADSIVRALHLADLITELNGVYMIALCPCETRLKINLGFCGFMSILSSMRYCLDSSKSISNVYAALALMPFGLFFDFMDGKVARWRGKSSLMGQELDSLADLVRDSTFNIQMMSNNEDKFEFELKHQEHRRSLPDRLPAG